MVKNILVTGVSTGIGYDIVRYFTQRGYRVFGSVRKDVDVERLQNDFPINFECLQFDVTDTVNIEEERDRVLQLLAGGTLTALINNAGYAQSGPMALLSDKVFRQQIEVNLFGVRNVTNAFLPLLGASSEFKGVPGKLINISSISGIFNTPMNGAYCVAKHALESLGEIYRRELRMFGIQVSSIQPGPIESELWDKNFGTMDVYLDTDYGRMAKKTNAIIEAAQRDALPAEEISKVIEHIINHRRPKLGYIVTRNKCLNSIVAKYLPTRFADFIIERTINR